MLGVLFAPETPSDADYVQRVAAIMRRTSPQGVAAALRGMAARPSSVETLLSARVPMIFIAGEHDRIVTRDMLRRIADQLPPIPMRRITEAGHMPMLEQPDATSAALDDFLAEVFSGM